MNNEYRKNQYGGEYHTLNFTKSKKRTKFRADGGGATFEEKYSTLGKIGLIGGLLYLITKK